MPRYLDICSNPQALADFTKTVSADRFPPAAPKTSTLSHTTKSDSADGFGRRARPAPREKPRADAGAELERVQVGHKKPHASE